MGLEDEDVVAVAVHREALGAGGSEVGVGLARVAELQLELGDQVGQRGPVALQALQHHRRALVDQGEQLGRVDQSGERAAGQAAAAGVARLGQHGAVLGHPDGRGADGAGGEQPVHVGEPEHAGQGGGLGVVHVHP